METTPEIGTDVVTVSGDTSACEVAKRMQREGVGSVVVLDSAGLPVGIVTDRDLALRVVVAGHDAIHTMAAAVMSQPLVSVQMGEPIERVIEKMAEHGIRRVPILEGDRLSGIVSLDDMLAHLASNLDDLGASVSDAYADVRKQARRGAALDQIRSEAEARLHDLRSQLSRTGEQAKEALLREFDALRDRIRRAMH